MLGFAPFAADPFATTGASVTYDAFFSDSATGSEVLLAVVEFSPSVSETVSGADAASAVSNLNAVVTEVLTAQDSSSAVLTFASNVSETVLAAQITFVPASTFGAAIIESSSGQDATQPALSANVFVLEYVIVADSLAGKFLWEPVNTGTAVSWETVNTGITVNWTPVTT